MQPSTCISQSKMPKDPILNSPALAVTCNVRAGYCQCAIGHFTAGSRNAVPFGDGPQCQDDPLLERWEANIVTGRFFRVEDREGAELGRGRAKHGVDQTQEGCVCARNCCQILTPLLSHRD